MKTLLEILFGVLSYLGLTIFAIFIASLLVEFVFKVFIF